MRTSSPMEWTYKYEYLTSQYSLPWIFRIVNIARIQEHRPLITRNCSFTALETLLGSGRHHVIQIDGMIGFQTYSASNQSRPAGQSNAPVTSWLNPRSDLMFCERGGMTACPLGTSHSRTADLRVLVSSPRAPEAPLPNCKRWVWWSSNTQTLPYLPHE